MHPYQLLFSKNSLRAPNVRGVLRTHTHTLVLSIKGVSDIVWMSKNCTAPDVLLRTPNVRDALRKKLVLSIKEAQEIAWVGRNCTTHDVTLRTPDCEACERWPRQDEYFWVCN